MTAASRTSSQTDAINRGNSGGALVSTRGRLVGINSQILSPSGGNIGSAFPQKLSEAEYRKRFARDEADYVRILRTMIATLNAAALVGDATGHQPRR